MMMGQAHAWLHLMPPRVRKPGIGYEQNPSIVDAALNLAASICRQVDAATAANGG
jgi:hypothetical protein